ncbi:MAG: hypothetical protein FWC55_00245 [Firmicutes bacterium]|nr:hypothetical protein [Bacillota bacterium]
MKITRPEPRRALKTFALLALLTISSALALSFSACGKSGGVKDANGDTPASAAGKALDLYKAQDYANFNNALTASVKSFSPDTTEFDAATMKAFSQIDYSVKSESVSGSTAKVAVSVTAIDIKTAVSETVTYSFNQQLSGAWDTKDTEKLQQQYQEYYDAYILDPARAKITADVNISLEKTGGIWKINPDSAFVDALTGFQSGTGSVDVVK